MNQVALRKIEEKLSHRKLILPKFAVDFLESNDDLAIQTQLEYAKDLQLFFEFLLESKIVQKDVLFKITVQDLKEIQEEHIQEFLNYLTHYKKMVTSVAGNQTVQEFKNSERGKERKRVTIHNLYEFLMEQQLLSFNPVTNIQLKFKKYQPQPYLTSYELNKMYGVALNENPDEFRSFRNFIILKLLVFTGIRISELTNLNIEDVWQSRNELVVTRKNGEQEALYMEPSLQKDFYRYLEMRKGIEHIQKGHEQSLFLSQRKRRMDPRSVRKMIMLIAKSADVEIPVTPQTFRRTFAYKHFNKYKDLSLTAGLLGNVSSESTRKNYANASRINSIKHNA